MRNGLIGLAAGVLLTGCNGAAPENAAVENVAVADVPAIPAPAESARPPVTDTWIGRWTGVDGLALDVAVGDRPGTYRLHVALMDSAGDYTGTADGDTIRFTRDGVAETIRRTSGAETGLKWLAEKKDCLTIKPGEGFCRN